MKNLVRWFLGRWMRNILTCGLMLVSVASCATPTPHENFKGNVLSKVGLNIDQIGGGWTRSQDLVSTVTMPNGNVAYTYKLFRSCRYTFEVNPGSRIIVAARWEGSEKDCVITP